MASTTSTSASGPTETQEAKPRFELGQLCYTPGAQALLQRYQVSPFQLLTRHVSGDWGEVCPEDAQANEDALEHGSRLFSVYLLPPLAEDPTLTAAKLWVITEADRSVTTLLLPEEY